MEPKEKADQLIKRGGEENALNLAKDIIEVLTDVYQKRNENDMRQQCLSSMYFMEKVIKEIKKRTHNG